MPWAAPKPCTSPGCPNYAQVRGKCKACKAKIDRELSRHRRQTKDEYYLFYQTPRWRKLRYAFIRRHPLCKYCEDKGKTVSGEVVDHIIPIKDGGPKLQWTNLQTLCNRCHIRKSNIERSER